MESWAQGEKPIPPFILTAFCPHPHSHCGPGGHHLAGLRRTLRPPLPPGVGGHCWRERYPVASCTGRLAVQAVHPSDTNFATSPSSLHPIAPQRSERAEWKSFDPTKTKHDKQWELRGSPFMATDHVFTHAEQWWRVLPGYRLRKGQGNAANIRADVSITHMHILTKQNASVS